MASFSTMSAPDVGKYIADNLTLTIGGTGGRKTIFTTGADKVKAPIYEIVSSLLPHTMFLFIHSIKNQQKVVDGRKMHVKMDFYQTTYSSVPIISPGEIKDDMKRSRNEWIDNQMRKLGRVSPEKQLTDTERKALMYQLYKQKQDDLYCMRSVHLDKDGWLPTVTIPNTLTTKQSAFKTYISDYTELPSNIQSKANAKSDKISAYVEYTAGNKSATEEFNEPRWRIVYDWVNDRFFLTWHYQPDFFVTTDGLFKVRSPWVYIEHAGTSGLSGPATQPTQASPDIKAALIKGRKLTTTDWG